MSWGERRREVEDRRGGLASVGCGEKSEREEGEPAANDKNREGRPREKGGRAGEGKRAGRKRREKGGAARRSGLGAEQVNREEGGDSKEASKSARPRAKKGGATKRGLQRRGGKATAAATDTKPFGTAGPRRAEGQ